MSTARAGELPAVPAQPADARLPSRIQERGICQGYSAGDGKTGHRDTLLCMGKLDVARLRIRYSQYVDS